MKNQLLRLYGTLALCIICTHFSLQAQMNQWAWMKGGNNVYQTGTYGTQGTAAPINTPGARYGSVSWKDNDGNMWLFGGYGYASNNGGYLNDLWKLTISTGNWAWIKGNSTEADQNSGVYGTMGQSAIANVPSGRYGSITWTDNNGNLWMMGGYGYGVNNYGVLNDVWKYNVSTGSWTWVKGSNTADIVGIYGTKGVAAAANTPGGRYGGAAWKDNSDHLWLFSGEGFATSTDGTGILNDLWKYNIATNNWTWIKGSNTLNEAGQYGNIGYTTATTMPGGRTLPTYWTDNNGNFWMWGGDGMTAAGERGYLSDLWKYDIATSNWTWMKGSSSGYQSGIYGPMGTAAYNNNPGGRAGAVSWKDNSGNLWLMGGYGMDANGNIDNMNDLWRYDMTTGYWGWVKGSSTANQSGIYGTKGIADPANMPGGRYFYVSWTDNLGNFWLTGGYGNAATNSGMLNDLWKFSPPLTILPLSLTRFIAIKQNAVAQLSWTVVSEQNISNYTIESSGNGHNFVSIGSSASLGNTTKERTYNYTDFQPLKGANYYRMKITETDGKTSYSEVKLLNLSASTTIALYPNPAKEITTLTGLEAGMHLQILNASGQIVLTQQATSNTETIAISRLAAGTYRVLVFSAENKLLNTTTLVKTP